MNLDELYSLRKSFSIIGLTGRNSSGCSEIGQILSKSSLNQIEDIRDTYSSPNTIFQKKYNIVIQFAEKNWKEYKVIEYKKVLLFVLLPDLYYTKNETLLYDFYREKMKKPPQKELERKMKLAIKKILDEKKELIDAIKSLGEIGDVRTIECLERLNDLFWGNEFNQLADSINSILLENGVVNRIMLLHHVANNLRKSGQPFKSDTAHSKNIYFIAKVINRIVKATKLKKPNNCHIVIDSLKNSLEINFFKERYSAFYLVAIKNDRRITNMENKLKALNLTEHLERLIEIDDIEYKSADFTKGIFYGPDVQNSIQIADYHVNFRSSSHKNLEDKNLEEFHTVGEQLVKLQALIQQPGLVPPDAIERVMQAAYTAKYNSGCISRQVGAAVTDSTFSIKAIGWNDVPKGAVPCTLRSVFDLPLHDNPEENNVFGFTRFELGLGLKETEQIHEKDGNKLVDIESKEFNKYIKNTYTDEIRVQEALNGRNCAFCFKSLYNTFNGDKNQVHTRSLHAEENAMLQISKNGGEGLKGGYLFTTASPCELCAKKAYQLGIRVIYYIDPYPGISRNHILKSNEGTDPQQVLFSGAVGRAYFKLYEPFLSQKDELGMLTGIYPQEPRDMRHKKFKDAVIAYLKETEEMSKEQEKNILTFLEDEKNISEILAFISSNVGQEKFESN